MLTAYKHEETLEKSGGAKTAWKSSITVASSMGIAREKREGGGMLVFFHVYEVDEVDWSMHCSIGMLC